MHSSRWSARLAALPLLMGFVLALPACGGGGGSSDSTSTEASTAGTAASSSALGTGGTVAPSADGTPGLPVAGSPGDDTYTLTSGNEVIVELPGGGTDTVLTSVSYQLPPNVENLRALQPGPGVVLTGNGLDNTIVGTPFGEDELYGLDGNDTLDGGGRIGGLLDGGNGNDRLILSFGTMKGGLGADTFVAGGRGAMTSPDVPITVLDFNAAEGDRIEIVGSQARSAADLFARGILRFDAPTSRLILDFDPASTAPTSVEQVFILNGVRTFEPGWVQFSVR